MRERRAESFGVEHVEHRVEARQLFARVGVVGFVGHGEVRAHTGEDDLVARAQIACASTSASSGAQPTRCMPVSILRCTSSGVSRPESATAFASASIPASV